MKKMEVFEPWFFLFFGVFHLHRIWGLFDRKAYADFWMGVLENKGVFYYLLTGLLAFLCLLGILTFLKNLHANYWWRWIYLFGGGYLLFDLFAILTGMPFWNALLRNMYDIAAPYWNVLWSGFIVIGGASFVLGAVLLKKRHAFICAE